SEGAPENKILNPSNISFEVTGYDFENNRTNVIDSNGNFHTIPFIWNPSKSDDWNTFEQLMNKINKDLDNLKILISYLVEQKYITLNKKEIDLFSILEKDINKDSLSIILLMDEKGGRSLIESLKTKSIIIENLMDIYIKYLSNNLD